MKSCDSGEFRLRVPNWISTSVLEIPWILRVAAFLLSYQKRFIWRYLHPRLMGVGGPHLAQDPGFKHQFVFLNDMFHVILLGFEKSVCLLTLVQEFGVLKSIFFSAQQIPIRKIGAPKLKAISNSFCVPLMLQKSQGQSPGMFWKPCKLW